VVDANTYDFVNYRTQFQEHSACFTPEGWQQFMTAVERSGNLETVKNSRLVASAVEQGAPIVTNQGLRKGVYSWEIQFPILASYQGGQGGRGTASQKLLVTLLVSRVPTSSYKEGVGIVQYIGEEK
jgi:intracellular multiplication protein IcmL